MRLNVATRDIFRIFTMLEHVSTDIKIKVMKLYTLKVANDNGIENIWSGDDMGKAIHYVVITQQHWGKHGEVWICNNMDEIAVG